MKNWRETTAYAGDEDFVFASDKLDGKHADGGSSPSGGETGDGDSTRSQVWLPQTQTRNNFLVEVSTDSKTIQDMPRWADPLNPALKVYAHSRMDKRMEAQAKMMEAMGLTEKTARSHSVGVGVGDRPWVILPVPCRQISDKSFGMMVARGRVEPPTPAFSVCPSSIPAARYAIRHKLGPSGPRAWAFAKGLNQFDSGVRTWQAAYEATKVMVPAA